MAHNDSSHVVIHARFTVFLMLLVSAVVLGSVFLDDRDRVRRAHSEMKVIAGLMDTWDSGSERTNTHSLVDYI